MKLLDQVRQTSRTLHYSIRTEHSSIYWIRYFIRSQQMKHPRHMGTLEISQFLSHLAINRNVSPPTQNVALNALLFLYQRVLEIERPRLGNRIVRAKEKKRIPTVFTPLEAQRVIVQLNSPY